MICNPWRSQGYALLIVMFLLAIAATALMSTGRLSYNHAISVKAAEEDLQRRWLVYSAEQACLDDLESICRFDADHSRNDIHTLFNSSCHVITLETAHHMATLVVTDEQAKIQVETLANEIGSTHARSLLDDVIGINIAGLSDETEILSDTTAKDEKNIASWPKYGSYAQLFPDLTTEELLGPLAAQNLDKTRPWEESETAYVHRMTCWGDGRVNFQRASAAVLEAVLQPYLTQSDVLRLVRLRDNGGTKSLEDMLADLGLDHDQQQWAQKRLTAGSQCYGLWIITSPKIGGSAKYHFNVISRSGMSTTHERWQW